MFIYYFSQDWDCFKASYDDAHQSGYSYVGVQGYCFPPPYYNVPLSVASQTNVCSDSAPEDTILLKQSIVIN